jgi:hypothetical protein
VAERSADHEVAQIRARLAELEAEQASLSKRLEGLLQTPRLRHQYPPPRAAG